MGIKDTWRRSLEYFGLVEGDYIEEGEYADEGDTGQEMALDRPQVAPREAAPVTHAAAAAAAGREDDIDDIFGDDEPAPGAAGCAPSRTSRAVAGAARAGNGGRQRRLRLLDARRHPAQLQRRPAGRRRVQALEAGDHQPSEHRPRALQAPDRLRLRHDLRARRRHAARSRRASSCSPPPTSRSRAEEKARMLEGGFFNQS